MQGEILYEEKLRILPGIDMGLVPEGRRVDLPFAGDISGPTIHGKIDGVDYTLIRTDGVALLHIHAVITTDGGDPISIEGSGFGTSTTDGRHAIKAALAFRTGSKEFVWLNSTQGVAEGFLDMNKREVNATIFKL